MKKFLKIFLKVILAILLVCVVAFAVILANEYKPEPVEELNIASSAPGKLLKEGQTLNILSWNVGYAGLGEGSEFFMDGGDDVKSADKDTVKKYLNGIADFENSQDFDLAMFQEVDTNSTRTYHIDERDYLKKSQSVHALNYSCVFVPYPMPPMGRINSGLFTTTDYQIDSAQRISLPCPFSWPVSACNLKRCLLVSYMPIEGSDKKLVLVNLHLEAYDDGEGKIAQTNQLKEFIQSEYEKGNYVIAGGDFNQIFPGGLDAYPNAHPDLWQPGILEDSMIPEGWEFAYDLSTPTCRLLNQPYDPKDEENTQHYVIDGFILSPNVELESVESVGLGFENSDHNPVHLSVKLG